MDFRPLATSTRPAPWLYTKYQDQQLAIDKQPQSQTPLQCHYQACDTTEVQIMLAKPLCYHPLDHHAPHR
jgi:hypothetical protein